MTFIRTRSRGMRMVALILTNTLTMASLRRRGGIMPERCKCVPFFPSNYRSVKTLKLKYRINTSATRNLILSCHTSSADLRILTRPGRIQKWCLLLSNLLNLVLSVPVMAQMTQMRKMLQLPWNKLKLRSAASTMLTCIMRTSTCLRSGHVQSTIVKSFTARYRRKRIMQFRRRKRGALSATLYKKSTPKIN